MAIKLVKNKQDDAPGMIPQGKGIPNTLGKAVKEFNGFFGELSKLFIDRDTELQQIKLALLTQEHLLLKGKPGTAKSKMARSVFKSISGGSTFESQLTKFMSEDYIFGPVNIKDLREKGEINHNTKGSIVDADFAFLDEFFDGSDVLLRSMLEVLNERSFTRNGKSVKCPLRTAILTSNYSREEEATEAVLDRILFKSDVGPIQDQDGRLQMYKMHLLNGTAAKKLKSIDFSDVESMGDYIKGQDMTVSDNVLMVFDSIIREYMRQTSKFISDRTCNKLIGVLKASAILHGRDEVVLEDIYMGQYALCTGNSTTETQVFESVYNKTIVQGKKEQGELVTIIKLKKDVERIVNEKLSNDEDKDTLMKIRALQKFAKEDLKEAQSKVSQDSSKEELRKIEETIDTAISGFKQTLGAD